MSRDRHLNHWEYTDLACVKHFGLPFLAYLDEGSVMDQAPGVLP